MPNNSRTIKVTVIYLVEIQTKSYFLDSLALDTTIEIEGLLYDINGRIDSGGPLPTTPGPVAFRHKMGVKSGCKYGCNKEGPHVAAFVEVVECR